VFRRALCCALTTLTLWAAAVAAQSPTAPARPSATSTKAAPGAATTRYSVSYRKAGGPAWPEYRTFVSVKEAQGAAKALYQKGYEVQVLARLTLTRLPPLAKTADLPLDRTVTLSQARQVFAWMAGQRDIAFRYPVDGCYARAHLMIARMQSKGYKPYKVWSFANGDPLHVRTPNVRSGFVEWKYHVAPVLRVRGANGKQTWAVIDPSMFKGPVTITAWRNAQRKPGSRYQPYITVTALGVAPKGPSGHRLPGHGYWPGPDPKEGLTRHAVTKMAEYKRKEPRSTTVAGLTPEVRTLNFPGREVVAAEERRRAA
jgi:Glutaminase